MARKEKTYEEAVTLAGKLSFEGRTKAAIAAKLNEWKYPTIAGGSVWQNRNVTRAIAEYDERKAASKPTQKTKQAPTALSPVSELPRQRRGLKRMLSADEWESMPEGLRDRVVAAIVDRMVG